MTLHKLKTWPKFYQAIEEGRKTFEVRENDRGFRVGDTLRLFEFEPDTDDYTGRSIDVRVEYILEGEIFPRFGIAPGWVVMSISVIGGRR
jgi:uncharacterized protein YqfB (UPF0267 family)